MSSDERASTTHLGNPPSRRLVDDSGQGTGDAGRITVACEHQFKQHCKAVDTFRRATRRNHPEPGLLGCVSQTVESALCLVPCLSRDTSRGARLRRECRDTGHVWEFLMGIVVRCTLDHPCALTFITSPSPAQKTHFHP